MTASACELDLLRGAATIAMSDAMRGCDDLWKWAPFKPGAQTYACVDISVASTVWYIDEFHTIGVERVIIESKNKLPSFLFMRSQHNMMLLCK